MSIVTTSRNYKNMGMYHRMMTECDGGEEEVIGTITEKISAMNLEYDLFVTDFTQIKYTRKNIMKYIDLCLFFDMNCTNKFITYIVIKYVFKHNFLDLICGFDIVQMIISGKLKRGYSFKDDDIIYINRYIPITTLNAYNNHNITDEGIKNLVNLTTLDASGNDSITKMAAKVDL